MIELALTIAAGMFLLWVGFLAVMFIIFICMKVYQA
jgi:hypothetical protein